MGSYFIFHSYEAETLNTYQSTRSVGNNTKTKNIVFQFGTDIFRQNQTYSHYY